MPLTSVAPLYLLGQDNCLCQYHMVPNSVTSGHFQQLDQDRIRCNMTFWSCNTTGTGVGITFCQLHQKWHHWIPYIRTIQMRCNMTLWSFDAITLASVSHQAKSIINGNIAFLRLRQLNQVQHDFSVIWSHWHHMIPVALVLVTCDATALVSSSCDVDSIRW